MSVNGKILATIITSILQSIDEAGVPEGRLYSALMNYLNLEQFNGIMDALKTLNAISISGHYITRGGNYSNVLGKFTQLSKLLDEKQ